MIKISVSELGLMEAVQKESFLDECTIDVFSKTTDSFGAITKTWVSGSLIACGFEANTGGKKYQDGLTVTDYSAKVRLPLEAVITSQDKVTVKAVQYSIKTIGHGRTCLIVLLEAVRV